MGLHHTGNAPKLKILTNIAQSHMRSIKAKKCYSSYYEVFLFTKSVKQHFNNFEKKVELHVNSGKTMLLLTFVKFHHSIFSM